MAYMNGIDISNWQKGINLSVVPADFVIMKATQGTWYVSTDCDRQYQQAKKAGRCLGVYHYAQGGNVQAEADYFLKNIQGYIGEAILVLDWEGQNNPTFNTGRDNMWVKQWCDYVYSKTNIKPMVYIQKSVLNRVSGIGDYDLWVAQYENNNPTEYQENPWNEGTYSCAMRQYSSTGRLSGYNGNLDLNKFYGDRTTWNKYAGKGNTDPDGEVKAGGTVQAKKDETGDVNYSVHTRGNGWMNQRCDGDMVGTTGQNRRIEAIKLWLKSGTIKSVTVHVRDDGDKTYNNPTKDTIIGTTGQKKRIEAIKIESDIPLRYRVHQKTYDWSEWKNKGEFAGVKGESKQIEAIEMYKPMFLVRGHIQDSGWSSYVGEREQIGTTGKSKRLEALQIDPLNETIECSAHIQGKGWVHYGVITKDTVIGTVGQAERLECLRFKGDFEFRVHVQGSGWTDWTKADGIATLGTTGQALRIEAIQFR